MPYVGGSLTTLFGPEAKAATGRTARALAEKGGDRMVTYTVANTPIHHGNLRSSWYQLITRRKRHLLGPAWESGVASDVSYAPHVEYGTGLWGPKHAKYPIFPHKPGGMLHWVSPGTGEHVFARMVMHPGSPGHHMVAIGGHMAEAELDDGSLGEGILAEWARTVEAAAH